MYYACMVALQIRDVPENVRDTLAARARENGQSLQAFLLALVLREASFSRNLDLIRELDDESPQPGPTVEDVLAALDDARAERGQVFGSPEADRRDGAA